MCELLDLSTAKHGKISLAFGRQRIPAPCGRFDGRRRPLRKQWLGIGIAAVLRRAWREPFLSPAGQRRIAEIVELQQQISQVLQQQQDLRSALDTNSATLKTLVQQALDSTNQLNNQMGNLQKTVQEVQANTGSSITSAQTTQGLPDNLQDVQARVGKLSQQMTDMQNLLQSIDAKVSGNPSGGLRAPGLRALPEGPDASECRRCA